MISISAVVDGQQVGVIVGSALGAAMFLSVLIILSLSCVILLWCKARHRTNVSQSVYHNYTKLLINFYRELMLRFNPKR